PLQPRSRRWHWRPRRWRRSGPLHPKQNWCPSQGRWHRKPKNSARMRAH
ncbi:hypothetical protein, partial [Labrys sp. 22185]